MHLFRVSLLRPGTKFHLIPVPSIAFSTAPWYHSFMTTVEILFRYATPPSDSVTFALASARDVYGIRSLRFDREARTLCVEYDATRLNAATVAKLVGQAGLDVSEILPVAQPAPSPEPVPAS